MKAREEWISRITLVKMDLDALQSPSNFHGILYKDRGAGILKLTQKHTEASGSHKITLSKMDNAGRILTTTFKLQFRATVTKVVWYPQKKKHSGKDLRTQI